MFRHIARASSCRPAAAFTRLTAAATLTLSLTTTAAAAAAAAAMSSGTFFDHQARTLAGEEFDFAQLQGRVTLVTNVASR